MFDDDDMDVMEVEANSLSEDEQDVATARKRLTEIKDEPARIVQGKELRDRLTRL